MRGEPPILARPRVRLDGALEAARNLHRLVAARKIRDEKAELVSAEARVEIAPLALPLDREEVLRPDLIGEDSRHALDDLVADSVAERVVVPLEAVDVDDADAAPAHALLDGEERLHALHEPVEVEELRLRIAVRLVGELRDDV